MGKIKEALQSNLKPRIREDSPLDKVLKKGSETVDNYVDDCKTKNEQIKEEALRLLELHHEAQRRGIPPKKN